MSVSPNSGRSITLQVGERRFVTTLDTLTHESAFFAALLPGRWDNQEIDGSYFIDADPELFDHILCYLRRSVLPIFWDIVNGHNHTMYLALLEEAKYFQIPRLEDWLKNKRYLHAIKISSSLKELDGLWWETHSTDEYVEYHPRWQTEKIYICPRGIPVHKGKLSACGRQCESARGDSDYIYEYKQVLKTLVIRKKVIFDQAACVEELE
ncbi:hypothetical protein H4I96_12105 [Botrytis cinerea]